MPPVNWGAFENLPGAAGYNFEMLCHALIRRHYGRHGQFAALAAQPGVEFHLRLHTTCALGDPGRWYGWQCRWYNLPSGRAIGSTRRRKIKEAIAITEKVLPDLTDWVLWTRRPLTARDQQWYYGLKAHMRLHLWTATEVEEHLSGEAEILRGTYFGELILTPAILTDLHEKSVAPIRRRWQPEVHQTIDAERTLRRTLGEAERWDDLRTMADRLEVEAAAIESDLSGLGDAVAGAAADVAVFARSVATALGDSHTALNRGDLDLVRQLLANGPVHPDLKLAELPRQLRARRHQAALTVTNCLSYARLSQSLLDEVDTYLSTRLIGVLAESGCGKTQLGAQLTATVGDRPAGIFLQGGGLNAGHNLDDLAHRVVIQGTQVPTMEALVAAVDAAGQRARRRLPIVIDGLNEAEDPRDWKGALASLSETLRHYPYVLVVCTVRTAFADEALPPDVDRMEIPDFGHDIGGAVRRYFAYYRIDAADAELPGLLRHPLTLRLFCEVTNPTRESVVGIEAMPGSLTALFDRYLDQAAARIAELAPRTHRYYEQDVRGALDDIGTALWESGARGMDELELRRRLGDDTRPWNQSIVRALEQEGVVLRSPGEPPGTRRVTAIYDALAGHLVADALLRLHGRDGFVRWVRDAETLEALVKPLPDGHPLAADILRALVGLFPRRLYRQQLWELLDEPLRTTALLGAADLEGAYLDSETVEALRVLVTEPPGRPRDLFDRLRLTRGSPSHPLNAEFLDAVLRPMAVADRDLRWTEWVRRRSDDILADLRGLEEQWRRTMTGRNLADQLRARWVNWTLTSTVRELRDQATRTLYWFGRGDAAALFELTLDALAINDPYVPERLLAASYGVAMAHQLSDQKFADALSTYLEGLRDTLTGPTATYPTSHWLARLYLRGTISFAQSYYSDAVPDGLEVEGLSFGPGPPIGPIASDDSRAEQVDRTLHMDFENYTLGRLCEGRANYDMNHAGHQAAVAHVRGTVWALGWRETGLGGVDKVLASYASRGDRAPTERYGKKYGWIGFYTYAGLLHDAGLLPIDDERLSDLDIDPSFPDPPEPAPIEFPIWSRPTPKSDRRWIREGIVKVQDRLLRCPDLGPHAGPWIAVDAYLQTERQALGRRVFGILTALLVADADADRLVDVLYTQDRPGHVRLPEEPSDYRTFAGEIPWSPEFARSDAGDDLQSLYRETVEVGNGLPIEVEILAHRYGWERIGPLNEAAGTLAPSRLFSAAFDLRGIPQSFSQTLPDGTFAALSLGAPVGFYGHLLYLREDLVLRYAAGRRLIWLVWGERQLYPYPLPGPQWLIKAQQNQADVWRHIRRGEELMGIAPSTPSGA